MLARALSLSLPLALSLALSLSRSRSLSLFLCVCVCSAAVLKAYEGLEIPGTECNSGRETQQEMRDTGSICLNICTSSKQSSRRRGVDGALVCRRRRRACDRHEQRKARRKGTGRMNSAWGAGTRPSTTEREEGGGRGRERKGERALESASINVYCKTQR